MEFRYEIFAYNGEKIEIRVDEDNNIWLKTEEIANLFNVSRTAIVKQIANTYKNDDLINRTCSILEQVQIEGNRQINRKVKIYGLDLILAIGYKINVKTTNEFSIWASFLKKDDKNSKNSQFLDENDLQIVKFEDNGLIIDVSVDPFQDTVWLTQDQISLLFDRERTVISRHIRNVFQEQEVDEKRNVQKMHIANSDKLVKVESLF